MNIRDHSGKKPMQYLVRQDTSVSLDTFKSESLKSPVSSNKPAASSIRRHLSSASLLDYQHNPNNRHNNIGAGVVEFVSLPTCNSNSFPKSPSQTLSPTTSRHSSSDLSSSAKGSGPDNLFSPKTANPHNSSTFIFPETAVDEVNSNAKNESDNFPQRRLGDPNTSHSLISKGSSRRSIRQGLIHLVNNAVPKRKDDEGNI